MSPGTSQLGWAFAHFARRLGQALLPGATNGLRLQGSSRASKGRPTQPGARIECALSVFLALGLGGCAIAPPQTEEARAVSQGITGGTETQACEWPPLVALGGCSGTLVHPSLVV